MTVFPKEVDNSGFPGQKGGQMGWPGCSRTQCRRQFADTRCEHSLQRRNPRSNRGSQWARPGKWGRGGATSSYCGWGWRRWGGAGQCLRGRQAVSAGESCWFGCKGTIHTVRKPVQCGSERLQAMPTKTANEHLWQEQGWHWIVKNWTSLFKNCLKLFRFWLMTSSFV